MSTPFVFSDSNEFKIPTDSKIQSDLRELLAIGTNYSCADVGTALNFLSGFGILCMEGEVSFKFSIDEENCEAKVDTHYKSFAKIINNKNPSYELICKKISEYVAQTKSENNKTHNGSVHIILKDATPSYTYIVSKLQYVGVNENNKHKYEMCTHISCIYKPEILQNYSYYVLGKIYAIKKNRQKNANVVDEKELEEIAYEEETYTQHVRQHLCNSYEFIKCLSN